MNKAVLTLIAILPAFAQVHIPGPGIGAGLPGTVPATLISHVSKGGPVNGNVASSSIDTTGVKLIVWQQVYVAGTTCTPTDSAGNTWTLGKTNTVTSNISVTSYYVVNPMTSSTHTFQTNPCTGGAPGISIRAYGGGPFAGTIDVFSGNNILTPGVTLSASAITPGSANEVCDAALGFSTGTSAMTANSGFTTIDPVAFGAGVNYGLLASYLLNPTSGTPFTLGYNWTGNSFAALGVLCIK